MSNKSYTPWTQEETEILMTHRHNLTAREIQKQYLPDRTTSAIYQRCQRLETMLANDKPIKSAPAPWTAAEDNILQAYYSTIPAKEIQEKYLPNRTVMAIQQRHKRLELTQLPREPGEQPETPPARWTKEEDDILTQHENLTFQEIQAQYLPHRTLSAIHQRSQRLGMVRLQREKPETPPTPWTPEEDEILRQAYKKYSANQIQEKFLPNRTSSAIYQRLIKTLQLLKRGEKPAAWSDEEKETLKLHFKEYSIERIQELFLPDRSLNSIHNQAVKLGLTQVTNQTKYTREENNLLKHLYKTHTPEQIRQQFLPDKPVSSISAQIHRITNCGRKSGEWTTDDDDLLKFVYATYSASQIQIMFMPNRSIWAIQQRCHRLGLSPNIRPVLSEEEQKRLEELVKLYDTGKLHERFLPNETPTTAQPTRITARTWQNKELQILRDHATTHTAAELHEKFLPNRTPVAITQKLSVERTKNSPKRSNRAWTAAETQILRDHAATYTPYELHKKFLPNRTPTAIAQRLRLEQIKQASKKNPDETTPWTPTELEHVQILLNALQHRNTNEICEKIKELRR